MQGASAQTRSDADESRRFEVGGHFTTLKDEENEDAEYGFGGRIGYNIHENVTLEAEFNLLPELDNFSGGDKVQGTVNSSTTRSKREGDSILHESPSLYDD